MSRACRPDAFPPVLRLRLSDRLSSTCSKDRQARPQTTERDREILTLLAEGHTLKEAAGHLGLRPGSVSNALGHMRARYSASTNEALIALAMRLQWIPLAIECTDPKDTTAQDH